jgi:hypothetical protein
MKRISILCTVAGALQASAALAWAPTAARHESSVIEAPAPLAIESVFPQSLMPIDCLNAWSKDMCSGFMHPGNAVFAACPFPPTACRTITVTDATAVIPLLRNETLCAHDGKCDESPQTDGTLKMSTNYELRGNDPCKFRGTWVGKWEITTVTGAIFQGDAMGTLGVGTNRKFQCPQTQNDFCEKCLDVEFIPTPIGGLWRIGWEGAFQGKRIDNPNGERLSFTINADWYLDGDINGPFDFSGNFRIYGAADGVHIVPCGL